jgi:hypothetical protein
MDPDLGGLKTYGSCGSGTLFKTVSLFKCSELCRKKSADLFHESRGSDRVWLLRCVGTDSLNEVAIQEHSARPQVLQHLLLGLVQTEESADRKKLVSINLFMNLLLFRGPGSRMQACALRINKMLLKGQKCFFCTLRLKNTFLK